MPNEAQQYGDRKVLTRPLDAPTINPGVADAAAFGAPIAEGVRRMTLGIAQGNKIRDEERSRVAATKAMDGRNQDAEAVIKLESQLHQRKLGNAKGLPDEYNTEFRKITEAGAERFKDDPEALDTYTQMMEHRRLQGYETITRHADNEMAQYEQGVHESAVVVARQEMLSGVISIDQSLAMQKASRLEVADRTGEPAGETDLRWQADQDKTIGAAINQQAKVGNFDAAQKIMDSHGKLLSPELRAEIDAGLKNGQESKKAQTYAAAIMQDPQQTKAKAYQQLKAIDDPELRERTRTNVEREFSQREAIRRDAQGSTYESMYDAIQAGESYDDLIAKNPMATSILDGNQTTSLRMAEQHYIDRSQPEEWGKEYTAQRNSASQFPEDFAKADLRPLKGTMRKAEYDDLNQRQQAIKAMINKTDDKLADDARGFLSVDQQVKASLRSIGIDPSDMKRGDEKDAAQASADRFMALMDKKIRAAPGGPKKVTPEQIQKFADDLILEKEFIVPASTFGKVANVIGLGFPGMVGVGQDSTYKVRAFEIPGYDKAAFSVEQMSAADRSTAIRALADAGVSDPTPDELLEWHNGTIIKNAQAP